MKKSGLIKVKSLGKAKKSLYDKAREARRLAYAPYSHFKVGAALRDEKGKIYIGCNVENASYSGTQCAERAAVTAMVAHGGRNIHEIFIVTDTPHGCPPCGFCRQVMAEFSTDTHQTLVHIANLSGAVKTLTLAELLPHAFNSKFFD